MLLSLQITPYIKEPDPLWYEQVLSFIENHGGLIGIITAVLAAAFWMRRFLRQRRAEAFFSFYTKLYSELKELLRWLTEFKRLNTEDKDAGNIYLLEYWYDKDTFDLHVPKYSKIEEKELKVYKILAGQLLETIHGSDNNVYPKGTDRKEWYDSINSVLNLCMLLAHEEFWNQKDITQTPSYMEDCLELKQSIEYIMTQLEQVSY